MSLKILRDILIVGMLVVFVVLWTVFVLAVAWKTLAILF